MHCRLRRIHGQAVHDLQGPRQHAAFDDGRDRVARLIESAVTHQHGMKTRGAGQQAQGDFKGDAEQSLAAAEEAGEVRPHALQAFAAELADIAIRQHRTNAQHMVGGHAVFEAVRAAGIEGDVAADRAYLLA